MPDTSRAVAHAVDEAGLSLPAPLLVVNGEYNGAASSWYPDQQSEPPKGHFKSVLLFSPKQKDENNYLTAVALKMLGPGGVFVSVAENEAGGKSLAKNLKAFGVSVTDHAKHKCRVVWTVEPQKAAAKIIEETQKKGGFQQRKDGLWTMPGLFSWDRLDSGTNILLHHLPFALKGQGADFGCGIGVLGIKMLQRYKDIRNLICLDKDIRALNCCSKNLAAFSGRFETGLADLSKPCDLPKLDFVVMNPPFHIGKKQSIELGLSFIRNAANSLKPEGILVFVANIHLPYEKEVASGFSFHRILREEKGFKIIEAIK